jgi:hypothetical protein
MKPPASSSNREADGRWRIVELDAECLTTKIICHSRKPRIRLTALFTTIQGRFPEIGTLTMPR